MADLLAAITVLMAFLTFLLQAIDKDIVKKIGEPIPNVNKIIERLKFKRELRNLLILKSIPISLAYGITAYTLFPKSISIIIHSKIDLWNFDPLTTIFVYIEFGAVLLMIYSIVKAVQLGRKLFSAS